MTEPIDVELEDEDVDLVEDTDGDPEADDTDDPEFDKDALEGET